MLGTHHLPLSRVQRVPKSFTVEPPPNYRLWGIVIKRPSKRGTYRRLEAHPRKLRSCVSLPQCKSFDWRRFRDASADGSSTCADAERGSFSTASASRQNTLQCHPSDWVIYCNERLEIPAEAVHNQQNIESLLQLRPVRRPDCLLH